MRKEPRKKARFSGPCPAPRLCAALCVLFFLPCGLFAGGAGSTAMQILKADISPRAMSMGGGFAAVADDIYAVQYNPAGLGQLADLTASAMYYSGFEDSRLQHLAVGAPVPVRGLGGLDGPVVALSALFTQNGSFTLRTLNADDTVTEGNAVNAESNRMLALSYGEKIYSGGIKAGKYSGILEQYIGLSAKYLSSTLLEEYSASGFALDAGWLVKETELGLAFGLSLANYGSTLKYLKDGDRVSSTARAGLAWQGPTVRDHTLLLTHEYALYTGEGLAGMRTGLEYSFEKMFSLRLGYKACSALGLFMLEKCDLKDGNGGASLGLGARHEGFAVDFGISLANDVFNTKQISVTYRFSGWKHARTVKTRRIRKPGDGAAARKKAGASLKKPYKRPEPVREEKSSDLYWLE